MSLARRLIPRDLSAVATAAAMAAVATLLPLPLAHADVYDNHGFYVEHPASWTVGDMWGSGELVVFSSGSGPDGSRVAVSLQDGYEVVMRGGEVGSLPSGLSGQDFLDEIVRSSRAACQHNVHGSCWYYELDDSRLVVVGGVQAASVRYTATLDDREITVREIVAPAGDGRYWVARGATGDAGPVDDMESILATFQTDLDAASGGGAEPASAAGGGAEPASAAGGGGTARTQGGSCGEDHTKATNIIPADPSILLEKTLDINLVLVGGEWTDFDRSVLMRELPSYCDPVFTSTGEKVGIRYLYEYSLVSRPDSSGLVEVMESNSAERPLFESSEAGANSWLGWWVWNFHREWITDGYAGGKPGRPEYRLVDALAVEEYLYENVIASDPDLADPASANLVFIRTDPFDVGYLYNYYLDGLDKSTGKRFEFVGLMGYGGVHNMQFFDLHAAPWIDIDLVTFKYDEPGHFHTLHDCGELDVDRCFHNDVSFHARSALAHVVTPSFLHHIDYHERYLVDVLVYVDPGGAVTVTPASLKSLISREKILAELEYLYPHAEWSLEMSVERRDLRGLSLDFKRDLDRGRHVTVDTAFGPELTFRVLDSADLGPHLHQWASDRAAERGAGHGGARIIPVLVVVGTTSAELAIDDIGVIGYAMPMPGDDNEPCCALAVIDEPDMWEKGIGMSDLVLHEVGHFLGLHHPFFSFDNHGAAVYNGYYNWYASPMTYSQPSSSTACGVLYSIVQGGPCGNPDTSFTAFERDRIGDARLVSLYRQVGAGMPGPGGSGAGSAGPAQALVDESLARFGSGDVLSARGALPKMIEAYGAAAGGQGMQPPTAGPPAAPPPPSSAPATPPAPSPQGPRVPEWVKSGAGWWADGLITDSEFANGIGFLIDTGVIEMGPGQAGAGQAEAPAPSGQQVPGWVKMNAGWWADGMISDAEFVRGMEFLVSNGVIRVGR